MLHELWWNIGLFVFDSREGIIISGTQGKVTMDTVMVVRPIGWLLQIAVGAVSSQSANLDATVLYVVAELVYPVRRVFCLFWFVLVCFIYFIGIKNFGFEELAGIG